MTARQYQAATLRCVKELALRYRENDPPGACPLCKIYSSRYKARTISGCFMGESKYGCYIGCTAFSSFIPSRNMRLYSPAARIRRAKFHERVLPILKALPAKRFHPKTWTYFKEISRKW